LDQTANYLLGDNRKSSFLFQLTTMQKHDSHNDDTHCTIAHKNNKCIDYNTKQKCCQLKPTTLKLIWQPYCSWDEIKHTEK